MATLCIVRHGQSVWNLENKFTGEVDVDLTDKGREEAREAGRKIAGIAFSRCYTSLLRRANETLAIMLEVSGHTGLPVIRDHALNERNYGDLQGLNKTDVEKEYGQKLYDEWRRSFAVRPPGGESLEDTQHRVLPYYNQTIRPHLAAGENVLIAAHGNSLRALMMDLEGLSPEAITHVDLPTGHPRVYDFDPAMKLLSAVYL